MKAPIIFCHYGNSKYLKYVFECVKISNPNKEIILLGDESNKKTAIKSGLAHISLADYEYGPDIELFDKIYQLIETKGFDSFKHGKDWNKFVFRKWFALNNFLIKNQIEKFWHFDSDNMIFTDLAKHEDFYADFDFSEQCDGHCIKGIFNSQKIVEKYAKKINEIFLRTDFINSVKKQMENLSHNACFNEMSVYDIFKEEEKFKIAKFKEVVNGTSFDDLICRSHGFKMEKLPFGEDVKLIHMNPDGRFFAIEEKSGAAVEMQALNLSWIPIYLYAGILKHFKKNHKKAKVPFDNKSKTLSDIPVPFFQRMKKLRKALKRKGKIK